MDQTVSAPEISSDDKLWALLAYLISPIVPIIILLMDDKKNRPFLRAHTAQALAWGIVVYVLGTITVGCVYVVGAVFSIIWGIKAYQGEYVNIPIITDFCKKQGWA
jgi:uncharacterized membrane protein